MANPLYQTPSSYIGKRGPGDPSGIDWTQQDVNRITRLYGPKKKNKYNPPWLRNLDSVTAQNPALRAVSQYLKATQKKGGASGGGAKGAVASTAQTYLDMLNKQQQDVMSKFLLDAQKQRQGQLASLAGFGAALQGYSRDLWGTQAASEQAAAAAQTSAAQGLSGQVGSGVAGMRAQEAALAGQLGYEGASQLPTAEQAAAQVNSEGGAKTGEMMSQVGTAWGGYGATRPEYIGFMTGQNQMQIAREGLQGDKDIRLEFAKLAMDNPKTAQAMYLADEENKRQVLSSKLAQQTLSQNMTMQQAKLKQQWYTARANAKDDAERRRIDSIYKAAVVANNQVMAGISQQNADAHTTSASASDWRAHHPTPPKPTGYAAAGNYQEAIGQAMGHVDQMLSHIYLRPTDKKAPAKTGLAAQKRQAIDSVLASLWPQMVSYIAPANRERAKKLLRIKIGTKVAHWTPSPKSSAGQTGY